MVADGHKLRPMSIAGHETRAPHALDCRRRRSPASCRLRDRVASRACLSIAPSALLTSTLNPETAYEEVIVNSAISAVSALIVVRNDLVRCGNDHRAAVLFRRRAALE